MRDLADGARHNHCLSRQGNEWPIDNPVPDSWTSVLAQTHKFPYVPRRGHDLATIHGNTGNAITDNDMGLSEFHENDQHARGWIAMAFYM
jgi:hypothetical protein